MELAKIIIRSRDYLDKFTYDDYPVCFEEFSRKASFFLDDLQEGSINAAADELIGCLERERALLKRRDASKALFLDKQVIALFLSPCCKKAGGKADTFADGVKLAAELIDSGKALETLNKVIEVSNRPEA